MVIPSMIKKFDECKNGKIDLWGDGSPIRDFIYSEDVARGMLKVVEKGYTKPINLGSGTGFSIKFLAETIRKILNKDVKINWDTSKPSGDKVRLMSVNNYEKINFSINFSLEEGLKKTIEWYLSNKNSSDSWRYNSFTEFEKK